MALIYCPECGREISSSAEVCPGCAYPVKTGTPPIPPRAAAKPAKVTLEGVVEDLTFDLRAADYGDGPFLPWVSRRSPEARSWAP